MLPSRSANFPVPASEPIKAIGLRPAPVSARSAVSLPDSGGRAPPPSSSAVSTSAKRRWLRAMTPSSPRSKLNSPPTRPPASPPSISATVSSDWLKSRTARRSRAVSLEVSATCPALTAIRPLTAPSRPVSNGSAGHALPGFGLWRGNPMVAPIAAGKSRVATVISPLIRGGCVIAMPSSPLTATPAKRAGEIGERDGTVGEHEPRRQRGPRRRRGPLGGGGAKRQRHHARRRGLEGELRRRSPAARGIHRAGGRDVEPARRQRAVDRQIAIERPAQHEREPSRALADRHQAIEPQKLDQRAAIAGVDEPGQADLARAELRQIGREGAAAGLALQVETEHAGAAEQLELGRARRAAGRGRDPTPRWCAA